MKTLTTALIASAMILSACACVNTSRATTWGPVEKIEFGDGALPQNLYSAFTGKSANSVLQYCLPASYSLSKDYPLIVYVPGFHGRPGGNIANAKDIAGDRECVVVSLPLFQEHVDRSEVGEGLIIGFDDYPTLSRAYGLMLQEFFERVPNVDREKSAMVGFSNGAIAIGVLVSSHDRYLLERFQSFCLVDHGMFHFTDLHKNPTRDKRFLILVGDEEDYGRELKIRAAQLAEDMYQLVGISVESRILENTGHELTSQCKEDIGKWVWSSSEDEARRVVPSGEGSER